MVAAVAKALQMAATIAEANEMATAARGDPEAATEAEEMATATAGR